VLPNLVETETDDTEDDSGHGKTANLDWFPANGVDGRYSGPVSWNGTGADDDEVTDGGVFELLVDWIFGGTGETDGLQDNGVVETKTIEGYIEQKP
jgi:hypothetical protein